MVGTLLLLFYVFFISNACDMARQESKSTAQTHAHRPLGKRHGQIRSEVRLRTDLYTEELDSDRNAMECGDASWAPTPL